jgi:hypothetical protein
MGDLGDDPQPGLQPEAGPQPGPGPPNGPPGSAARSAAREAAAAASAGGFDVGIGADGLPGIAHVIGVIPIVAPVL